MASETRGSPAGEKKLEQYGVWVKVKPREVPGKASSEDTVDLSDLESPPEAAPRKAAAAKSALTAEEEKLLDDLDTRFGPGDTKASAFVPEEETLLEESELPDIETGAFDSGAEDLVELTEEELPELDDEPMAPVKGGIRKPLPAAAESEIEVTLSDPADRGDHFDDLAELESELASVGTTARGASAASSEILARIEEELRSIRTDLTQLRTELSGLRARAGAQGSAEDGRGDSAGGFFDEDEDETIALTGDELDNILNTADVTEESAEASTADLDDTGVEDAEMADLPPDANGDILSYETPGTVDSAADALAEEVEMAEAAPEADDTLVLADDELLPGDDEGTADLEELPSELVLEDLGGEARAGKATARGSLDDIPELEPSPDYRPGKSGGSSKSALDDVSDETIDLETLDMGEEPRVIDAVPEQVEDLETVADAEPVLDEEPAVPSAASSADDVLSDDVDLEALAAEAAELEDDAPLRPTHAPAADLDLAELETIEEETEPSAAAEEINIAFEADAPKPSPDVDAELEQILDAEEVEDEAPTGAKPGASAPSGGTGAIPDNLKDEIRTVLKYMDHLLEALPDEKIQEFASSDYFVMYKKLFEDLGLGE